MLIGPANAISVSVTVPNTSLEYGQTIDFLAKIDIDSNERVPIENLTANIYDETDSLISSCTFSASGEKISCDSSFLTISNTKNSSNFNQGERNVVGFDNVTTNFGYGYGFTSSSTSTELEYSIVWQTPFNQTQSHTYKIKIDLNAQSTSNQKTYSNQIVPQVNVQLQKPTASLSQNTYSVKEDIPITLDASSSNDPNNFNITEYLIFENSNQIKSSSSSSITLENLTPGSHTYQLFVKNIYNITSNPYTFTIDVTTSFNEENFNLDVDSYTKDSKINFKISNLENFNNKKVQITPSLTCLNIPIDYKDKYLSTSLVLNEKKDYSLQVDRRDFDLNIPLDNLCEFKITLIDENNQKVTLSQNSIFTNLKPNLVPTQVSLNNDADLIGYIFSSFDKNFNKGFNTVRFNFKNSGNSEIKVELQVSMQDFNFKDYEDFRIQSNTDSQVSIPFYISEDTKKGRYPIRISYRINEGELKTKYGFINVN